jgi:adenylate cyclase
MAELAGLPVVSVEQVVVLANDIFSAFDDLVASHGLEKIKTIGDGYLVAAGIPTPRADHAEAAARLALDMRETLAILPTARVFGLRVGDSGPVVAGVIGRRKFRLRHLGRHGQHRQPHGVPCSARRSQVTERTYGRLSDRFVFEKREGVAVKGKMTTYLLVVARPARVTSPPAPTVSA